jgi:hypothetical protein
LALVAPCSPAAAPRTHRGPRTRPRSCGCLPPPRARRAPRTAWRRVAAGFPRPGRCAPGCARAGGVKAATHGVARRTCPPMPAAGDGLAGTGTDEPKQAGPGGGQRGMGGGRGRGNRGGAIRSRRPAGPRVGPDTAEGVGRHVTRVAGPGGRPRAARRGAPGGGGASRLGGGSGVRLPLSVAGPHAGLAHALARCTGLAVPLLREATSFCTMLTRHARATLRCKAPAGSSGGAVARAAAARGGAP